MAVCETIGNSSVCLDHERGRRRLGPDIEEYLGALEFFSSCMQDALMALERALRTNDGKEIWRQAQYLRALAGTMGATKLEAACRGMERALQWKDLPGMRFALEDIHAMFAEVRQMVGAASLGN